MLTRIVTSITLAMGLSYSHAAPVGNLNTSSTEKTDRIIVRYHDRPTHGNAMAFIKQGVTRGGFGVAAGKQKDVLEIGANLRIKDVNYLAKGLEDDPQVAYAEPDYFVQKMLVPNDSRYNEQWHYFETTAGINMPTAWDITTGSASVVVGVIDTGILYHADIQSNVLSGYDFISSISKANDGDGRDSNPTDPGDDETIAECGYSQGLPVPASFTPSSWHGTHVSGTIAAVSNNGSGVTGVAWNSKILPLRALGVCGGYTTDVVDAMKWAAGLSVSGLSTNPNPVKVLNLSLGGSMTSCPRYYQEAIDAVTAAGVTVVVAAGNANTNVSSTIPANCNNVITVASINRSAGRSAFSNYGSLVDISAPGGGAYYLQNGVLSTSNTGLTASSEDSYEYLRGTSMATPHVAGVVALMYSLRPNITPARVEELLKNNARSFPGTSNCTTSSCGAGILDATAVLQAVQNEPLN